MKDIKKEIIEEFKKFTQIVEYTKWSDEDNVQRLPQAELVWIDSIKNNPKIVEKWIESALTRMQKEVEREVAQKIIDTGNSARSKGLLSPSEQTESHLNMLSAINQKLISIINLKKT